jgi:DNA replication initiation complex subunit (GINS family)
MQERSQAETMSGRYGRLRRAWERENEKSGLQNIPDEFLHEMRRYSEELNKTLTDPGTLIGSITKKERQFVGQMLRELAETRLRKIVTKELRGEPIDAQAMTPEEQRLHANLRQLLLGYRHGADIPEPEAQPIVRAPKPALTQRPSVAAPREAPEGDLVVVRFLKPLPAIMGVDMKAYGPFDPENVASIPRQNAVNLIRRGIAKLVDIEP